MSLARRGAALMVCLCLAGCSTISGTYPRNNSVIPNASFQLTPGYAISLEKVLIYAGVAYAAYVILDPFAPNWSITQARMDEDRYAMALEMKRYHTGGDGEARVVFHRRAQEVARANGYTGYEVLSWQEGIESGFFGAKRNAEGAIRLTGKHE